MRWSIVFDRNAPARVAADAPPHDEDLELQFHRMVWVARKRWGRSRDKECNRRAAQGANLESGFTQEGRMLLETDAAVEARKKALAALCKKRNCKKGCSKNCGCARRDRPRNDRCFCRKNESERANAMSVSSDPKIPCAWRR